MKRSPVRQFVALLVAVLVAVTIGASAVKANDMTVEMAVAADMAMAVQDDCDDCLSADVNTMPPMTCVSLCTMPALLTFPAGGALTVNPIRVTLPAVAAKVLLATKASPEPYPPRSITLG